ncbi:I[[h]] channel [Carabus blaptoides fortunei]
MMNYVRTYFLLDLLSSLYPVYYGISTQDSLNELNILVIGLVITGLKLLRLFPCMKYLHSMCEVLSLKNYKCKLTLIIVCSLVLTHWITCVCIIVSTLSVGLVNSDTPLHQSWIARDDLWNSSQLMIYTTGLMRTACLMSNAEYEANEHQTTEDQLVMCIMWILTGILLTLLISFLIQITRSIISSQTKYKEMVLQLKQYMHHKQLSAHTQNRLINYYEFRFQRRFFRDEEILSMISGHLRQEIRRHKCQKLVENVPFFQGLPQFLLIRIISCLQLEIFLTHDVIIKGKTRGTSMYFIASGTVAVYSDTGREIYHRYDGQHFGETSMIRPDILRIATMVATEPCELYRLDRKDFFNIIQPFPELLAEIEQGAIESLHDITAIDDKHRQCHIDKYKNKPNII